MQPNFVAVFPGSIDPVLAGKISGVTLVHLIGRGSREESWVREFIDRRRILTFDLKDESARYSDLNTESLLKLSNIDELLKSRGIKALLITHRCTAPIQAWARRNRIRLVCASFQHQKRLENKIEFDSFMERHGVPRPESRVVTARRGARLPFVGRQVLQEVCSFGSSGTYFLRSDEQLRRLISKGVLQIGRRYLVRRYVDGPTFGITVFVAGRNVALSSLRLQCFYPFRSGRQRVFAGIQWFPRSALTEEQRSAVERVFLQLGRLLYAMRYNGFANFDFILRGSRPLVIECNPRLSSATPQLFHFPELISGLPLGRLFLGRPPDSSGYEKPPVLRGLPECEFEGSLLDLIVRDKRSGAITESTPIGLYAFDRRGWLSFVTPDIRKLSKAPELIYHSEARVGERYNRLEQIGSVISSCPLFDRSGILTPRGERVLEHFELKG